MDQISLRMKLEECIEAANANTYLKNTKALTTSAKALKYLSEFLSTKELNNLYGLYLFMENNPEVSDILIENAILNNSRLKTLKDLYHENNNLLLLCKQFEFGLACKLIAGVRERVKYGTTSSDWYC